MKKHRVKILIIVLVLFTILAAALHLNTRKAVPEGTIQLTAGEKEIKMDISKFAFEQVNGIRVNGRGEEIPVNGPGIAVKDVLALAEITDYEVVKVISGDSYSAEISADEVKDRTKAFLLYDEENELRLVVFGDANSKRSVSDVVQIVVE